MMLRITRTFLLLLIFSGFVHADKIVVWNLKPQTGVTEKESITVTSILTSEIERISKQVVVGENEMRSVIDGEQLRMSCGADDNSCIAEVGATLGAPMAVSGILSKMGDYWVINIQLIDVRKAEVKARVTKKFKGDVNSLVESLTPLVCELFGQKECAETNTAPSTDKQQVAETKPVAETKTQTTPEPKRDILEKKPVLWKKATGWTFTAAGALVLVGGIVSNVQMYKARDDFEETGKDEDSFKMWRGLTVGGYVTGSVFLAGGVALLIWDAVEAKSGKEKNATIYMLPVKDGFYAGIQGRW